MELHAGIFSGLVQLVAEFGCKFPDDAELLGLRLQHALVLSLTCCQMLLPTVAALMACNNMEIDSDGRLAQVS